MYAVIETGGKQYRVEVGTELEVELLEVEPGRTITIERVLLVADGDQSVIGRPLVADASVSAEVVTQTRGPKLISFKYRPKARSRVKKGHRQELTVLRISDITFSGRSAATSARKAQDDAKTERQRLEEAAATQAAQDAQLAARLAVRAETPAKPASRAKTASAAAKPVNGKVAKAVTKPAAAVTKPAEAKTKPAAAKTKPAEAKTADEAPKRGRASASAAVDAADAAEPADAGASKAKPDVPKRSRATKKDE